MIFFKTHYRSKLEELNWHCVKSAELPTCLTIIENDPYVRWLMWKSSPLLIKILREVRSIRKNAVHHRPLSARDIRTILGSAIQFVSYLGDNTCTQQLSALRASPMLRIIRLPKLPPTSLLVPVEVESLLRSSSHFCSSCTPSPDQILVNLKLRTEDIRQ